MNRRAFRAGRGRWCAAGTRPAFTVAVVSCALVLSACSDGNMGDLYVFVEQTKARQKAAIEPLPSIRTFETFTYSANRVRDPFVPPAEPEPEAEVAEQPSNGISPDFNRAREDLERYALDSLRMVGTLARDDVVYGVVLAPGGGVYRVQRDNYMGKNHGRIRAITEDRIELVEIVSDGAEGWEERLAAVALSD